MGRLVSGAVLAVGIALGGCVTHGGKLASPDTPIGSVVTPGRTQVPLPPGEWKEIARYDPIMGVSTDPYTLGSIRTSQVQVAYAEIVEGRIRNLLRVSTNTDASSTWLINERCLGAHRPPESLYFKSVESQSVSDTDCLKVFKVTFGQPSDSSSFYGQYYKAAKQYGGIPRDGVEAWFHVIGSMNFMNYELVTFPERNHVTGNAWDSDAEGVQEKKFTDGLIKWATGFRQHVVDGTNMELK
jgi:hypothetical protein